MTMTIRKAVLGVMLLGGLSLGVVATAHAGCCGGGGGHTFGRTYYAGYGGGCGCSMNMAGMNMGGMQMPAMQMPAGSMQGMNMGGYAYPQAPIAAAPTAAAPAAANGARYTCSMHPNVVSTTPGSCPICGMALTRK